MLRTAFASSRALRFAPRISSSRSLLRSQVQAVPVFITQYTQIPASRWYSDIKNATIEAETTTGAEDNDNGAASESDPLTELKKQLETKDAEVRDWKDKCLRSIADFRNLQDRTQREVKSAREFAIQGFGKDLIDSIDNLDRALLTVEPEKLSVSDKTEAQQDLFNLHEGLKMTETILMQTLAKHGLHRVDPSGEKFNPNEHEATFMAPQPDKEDGLVFHVQQKGFKLNGRVLRAAKVGVVKNK